ncbi:MAG TPA: metallophosphoesterase family protein [Chloroflexota bacterium]|jgi:serine/threonine protein phosphatase 1|nr:metallophosphoesterase family protein [Chloroflexota bacterium]
MPESRLIAIGDIHGAVSALHRLLQQVEPGADDTLLFLGDYVDRGEDSRAVLDALITLEQTHRCIFLKGNHEDMLLKAIQGGTEEWLIWLGNGGVTTLRDFDQALPPARYLSWLQRLDLSYETDSHYYVHAGLLPGVPPAESTDMDRLWIREPFLSSTYDWGKRVVFGHTVQLQGPLVQPNKIGIDTGACLPRMGRLTAMILPTKQFVFSRGRARGFS